MKHIIKISALIAIIIFSLYSCEIDNLPGPDAQFRGAIKDVQGNELVETDLVNGSTIGVYEHGYENPVLQNWLIKNNGEFCNNLVFSNTYDIVFQNCNFFPFEEKDFKIKPGLNEHTFLVTPYIRVKNLSIVHDAASKKIVASFKLEGGKPSVKLSKVTLYAFTDIHVGRFVSFEMVKGDGEFDKVFDPAIDIETSLVYTLSIDLKENADLFSIHRNYYFRVGALAYQDGVGTIRRNYAPYVKIAL